MEFIFGRALTAQDMRIWRPIGEFRQHDLTVFFVLKSIKTTSLPSSSQPTSVTQSIRSALQQR